MQLTASPSHERNKVRHGTVVVRHVSVPAASARAHHTLKIYGTESDQAECAGPGRAGAELPKKRGRQYDTIQVTGQVQQDALSQHFPSQSTLELPSTACQSA